MARRSLRPHLNQIRGWVRQGRTDAWIAHQLEATVQQIEVFKRDNDLAPAEAESGETPKIDFDDEIDLRAEDDALVAAELEAAEARKAEEDRIKAEEEEARKAEEAARRAAAGDDDDESDDDAPARATPRRRGRRGGRGRAAGTRSATGALEGTFDHGEDGYGLWLDPAVTDNPIYAEHWAGHRPVEVTIEEDQIVIRRAGPDDD
jgi:membrane protein involved in colicin uptake